MRKSRFSDSQILAILKQNEQGLAVGDICREHGVSSAQFYKWRSKFGGMDASMTILLLSSLLKLNLTIFPLPQ
jgi:putative transposase